MSSDDSAIFFESESASIMAAQEPSDLDEIYKYIPPPIPLIPKNKYKECVQYLQVKNYKDSNRSNSLFEKYKNNLKHSFDNSDSYAASSVTLISVCEASKIVYQRDSSKSGNPCFSNKVKLDNLSSLPKFENKTAFNKNSETLLFESKFESGNLALAFKKSNQEYNLLMQNDINTKGHTQ